ncbi:CaiB/BaiF CoA transferase family protein [Chelativorans alearense]|uniref:CaiB/BaiF CoA transferase family protein n=1 Tax=Chelativorans alearense TaxID=2681495 RepID=UPI0013CF937D|nr:CoA transferase [Chelativorans alearense]
MASTKAEHATVDQHLPFRSLPIVSAGTAFGMLKGIRVVDLTTSVAGPYATMLLSDFGAEVIKIERPTGDEARKWGPPFLRGQSLWFAAVNRNKKSVAIDVHDDDSRAALMQLVGLADVVVTSHPPAVQRKLRLDYETLRQEREDIVFASITGFGLTGARSDLTCYDLIAEGYSGIMDITGEANGDPQKIGAPAADMLAGQDAAMAVIAALFERQRTGKGHLIDVALVESMTRFLSCRIASYLGSGEVPTRSGGRDSVIAIYQAFETADLPMNLGLGSDEIWKRFWMAVGDPDYGTHPQLVTNAERRNARSEIAERIQRVLRTKTRDDWLAIFAKARVPAGPINRIDEVVSDRNLQDRGLFFVLDDGSGHLTPQVGLGLHIDGATSIPSSAPPDLGEHTEQVLAELRARR